MTKWLVRSATQVCEWCVFALCLVLQAAMVMGGWALVIERLAAAP